MKMKSIITMMLVTTMSIVLVACGTSSDSETSSNVVENTATTEESGENKTTGTTLSVSIWDTYQEPGIKEILADFTAETGIETSLSVVTWTEYWTVLEAGAQGGALPDVFWMHSNESQRYMSNDMLLNITDQISNSEKIDPVNYPQDIFGLYTYEDQYYAVPKDIDTIAIWYNKAMFDEAGLEYPTADWTWDDMTEMARVLTKEDGSQYGIAVRNDNNQAGYYNMIYSNGGSVLTADKSASAMDDPATIEGLKILETWIDEGLMPSAETMSENPEDILLQSGKVAMVIQGSWMLAAYENNEYTKENCEIVELPSSATTNRRVSLYNGLGWAAASNTKYPEEAWQLLEYLGSKEAQEKQAELGVTMSAYTGTSGAWVNSATFNLQAYINMMEDMEIRPYTVNTVTWELKNNEILLDVYTGNITMEEACQQMATQMNEIIATE